MTSASAIALPPSVKPTAPASREQPDLGQLAALEPLASRRRRCGSCASPTSRARRATNSTTDRLVDRRVGVGQRHHGRDAAGGRGGAAALDRLLMLGAGLAQLDAHVDKARREARRRRASMISAPSRADVAADAGDPVVLDQQVAGLVEAARRVDQPRVADEERTHVHGSGGLLPRSRVSISRQAMRTATPISTCWRISAAVDVVGDLAVDLDAAVHRPRMHDQRVRLGRASACRSRGRRSGNTRGSRARTSRASARSAGAAS